MSGLVHLPADAPLEEVAAALDRDGALILDSVIPLAQVDALVAELRPYVEGAGALDRLGRARDVPSHRL